MFYDNSFSPLLTVIKHSILFDYSLWLMKNKKESERKCWREGVTDGKAESQSPKVIVNYIDVSSGKLDICLHALQAPFTPFNNSHILIKNQSLDFE